MKATKISEVMTGCLHSVGFDQPIKIAQEMMRKYNIRHLPVENGGKLVGILTSRDIYLAIAIDKKFADSLLCQDVCTLEPYVVEPNTLLADVVSSMAKDKLGSAIILDKGKVVGIYTTVDACRDFAASLGS